MKHLRKSYILKAGILFIATIFYFNNSINAQIIEEKCASDQRIPVFENNNPLYKSSKSAENQNISLLGRWAEGPCYAVDVQDNIVSFGNGDYLMFGDITDPSNPVILSEILLKGEINDIVITDTLVYISCNWEGIYIIDISDLNNPEILSKTNFEFRIREIIILENYVYAADYAIGLTILDISDPVNPVLTAQYDVRLEGDTNGSDGIEISGNYAYLKHYHSGVNIIDISDPENPVQAALYDPSNFQAHDIDVFGNYLYVADCSRGLTIIDISTPSNPVKISSYPNEYDIHAKQVIISGHYAIVTGGKQYIIDISDPYNPELIHDFHIIDSQRKICISGNYMYCACYDYGLKIVDLTDSTNPFVAGSYKTGGISWDIDVSGDIAYIAGGHSGLILLDISDPSVPYEIGSLDYTYIEDIYISGDYLYLNDGNTKFHILDISIPSQPNETGYVSVSSGDGNIHISGNYAYIISFGQLNIIDISDKTAPAKIDSVFMENVAFNDVDGKDNHVYVTYKKSSTVFGVKIFKISNSSKPVEVGNYITEVSPMNIYIKDKFAYISNYVNYETEILYIRTPSELVKVGTIKDVYREVCVENNIAYYYKHGGGIAALDLSDPFNPVEIGNFVTNGSANRIYAVDNKIYVATFGAGVYVLQNDIVTSIDNVEAEIIDSYQLYNNYPNPFNPETRIKFWLPEKSFVTLKVYNIAGQVVKTLVSENLNSRIHNYTWDGTNEAGQQVSSGVYIYKLQAGNITKSKKMLLVR